MLAINSQKAMEITQDKIRAWRESKFEANDVEIQNALADGDTATLAEKKTYRDYLRNLPQECEGKTVEDLQVFMKELGV